MPVMFQIVRLADEAHRNGTHVDIACNECDKILASCCPEEATSPRAIESRKTITCDDCAN